MDNSWAKKIGWFFIVVVICGLLTYLALQTVIFWSLVRTQSSDFFPVTGGEKIGVVSLEGTIKKIQPILDRLDSYEERDDIKALLLDINSPGGLVGPSQELSSAVADFGGDKKPVIAFIRSTGASGAYYVASSADTIVVNPGSLVGSIGVIMKFVSAKELVEKVGLDYQVVKSGEYKDLGSPFQKMSDDEQKILKNLVMDVYEQFINHVADSREELSLSAVKKIADGRVFTGRQSRQKGLVDLTGGRKKAIEVAKKAAGIEGEAFLKEAPSKSFSPFRQASSILTSFSSLFQNQKTTVQLLYRMPLGDNFANQSP